MQAWWPNEVVENWTQQEPAWFMSALLSYWAVFGAFYRVLRRLPAAALWPTLAALWACSWYVWADCALHGWVTSKDVTDGPRGYFYGYHPLAYLLLTEPRWSGRAQPPPLIRLLERSS